MNNFPIEHEGKTYWVSRSIAVVCYVYAHVNGKLCVLANKRGPGVPNNVGKWNCPQGFLDYNETLQEAACREVWEETGVKIKKRKLRFIELDSDPSKDALQVVVVRFAYHISRFKKVRESDLTSENSEPNEVVDVKWIPVKDIENYDWVSSRHKYRVKQFRYHEKILRTLSGWRNTYLMRHNTVR